MRCISSTVQRCAIGGASGLTTSCPADMGHNQSSSSPSASASGAAAASSRLISSSWTASCVRSSCPAATDIAKSEDEAAGSRSNANTGCQQNG